MTGAAKFVRASLIIIHSPLPTQFPWPPAGWRLIATPAKLEFGLTDCNRTLLTISNRNKKYVSATAAFASPVNRGPRYFEPGPHINLRPVPTGAGTFLIGNVRIEIASTHRKQRRATNSNR